MITSDYINYLVFVLVGRQELVDLWWTTPNRSFNMRCPCELPETEVIKYLESYCFK